MKLAYFLVFAAVLAATSSICQDKVILANGDSLSIRLIKIGTGTITFKEGGIERELRSDFVSKIILSNGKETVFHEIPTSLDFERHLIAMKYSDELTSEIGITFPNALRREFIIHFDDPSQGVPVEYFLQKKAAGLKKEEKEVVNYFKFLGYGCNAFLGLVNVSDQGFKYVFYSNPIPGNTISTRIIHKSYKLVDSDATGWLGIADMTLKPFTMEFREGGECLFAQGGKDMMLEYKISENGSIAFRNPKKRNDGTTYQVVFLDDDTMRYTQFSSSTNIITRKVEVIK